MRERILETLWILGFVLGGTFLGLAFVAFLLAGLASGHPVK